ncbi:hypothetical protein HT031_003954 [Scenedesmus sp. PABB004]|nr:hypothetical protein HT031_003954 [Scenedesmus sp. PABB004]
MSSSEGNRCAGPTIAAAAPAVGEAPDGDGAAPSPWTDLPEPLMLHVLSFLPLALQGWTAKQVCKAARDRFCGATVVSLHCRELLLAAVQQAWRAVGGDVVQQRQLAEARPACGDVAGLAWLRGAGCDMDYRVCGMAACNGEFAVVEWGRDQGLDLRDAPPLPWGEDVCFWAAARGNLEMLRWARAQAEPAPWDTGVCSIAAQCGRLEALRWLRANGCPWRRGECSLRAAQYGHDAVAAHIGRTATAHVHLIQAFTEPVQGTDEEESQEPEDEDEEGSWDLGEEEGQEEEHADACS